MILNEYNQLKTSPAVVLWRKVLQDLCASCCKNVTVQITLMHSSFNIFWTN